ncbi:type II toxin-antitoxin system RelE/ParE family toxin [Burkholderia pseudomallei]|nr:type II toxin-antitoxin system RelE/ParE family toxin [Burkholderia pseudomallei]
MLHAFVKKTQETPRNELRVAQERMSGIRND